ncbi:conjugal transfer protein TraL [Vibrio parahaemolyticus]|nr:conjugal transfer protein TraL [Vibrio parahaemolyticus]HBC3550344.1 conjugal transfer protein TraL [Vibrio parahaemolyticus]
MKITSVCTACAVFALAAGGALTPVTVKAASQNECAIWLCLPAGFPSGCGAARSAFRDRIRDFKPPLPNFLSCIVQSPQNGSQMNYDYNYAALIAGRRECMEWEGRDNARCVRWEVIPEHYIKGTRCYRNQDFGNPAGCIATKRYVDVYLDGQQTGDTYFW